MDRRARAGRARRRRRARRAQLPHAQGARRPRPGRRRGHRLHPLRHRRRHDHGRRPRRHLASRSPAASSATRRSSAPSAASPASARCSSPAAAATGARSSSCPRSRPARRRASRCCTCASTTASTRPTMRGVLVGYDRRYDRLVDWVTETEGAFDDRLLGELPVDELLIEPISDTADHWRSRRRRDAARAGHDRHRGRRRRDRALPAGAGAHAVDAQAAVHGRSSSTYVAPKADPVPSLAARFAAREAVMKALGLGLGAFGFHDVWVEVEPSGAPRLVVTGRARELAVDRGRRALAPVAQPRRSRRRRHGRRRVSDRRAPRNVATA